MVSDSSSLDVEANTTIHRQKRLLTPLLKDRVIPVPTESERTPHPYQRASFLSKIFFEWLIPLINVGYNRTLQEKDLHTLTDDLKVEANLDKFNLVYQRRLAQHKSKYVKKHAKEVSDQTSYDIELSNTFDSLDVSRGFKPPSYFVLEVIILTYKSEIAWFMFFAALMCLFSALSPLVSKNLIQYVEMKAMGAKMSVVRGVWLAIGVSLMTFISGVCINHFTYRAYVTGIKTKSVLTQAILHKSFRLSARSRKKFNSGSITSILTTDLSRIEIAFIYQGLFLLCPLPIAISIVILAFNIGVATVVSIAVLAMFFTAVTFTTKKLFNYRESVVSVTDSRVSAIREVISNLKMIKYYSWEIPYLSNITKIRSSEISLLNKMQTLRNLVAAASISLVDITTMVGFLVLYALEGSTKNPAAIFASVSAFQIVGAFIFFIPTGLSTGADLLMGFKRVGELLAAEEVAENSHYQRINDKTSSLAIRVENGEFEWEKLSESDERTESTSVEENINSAFEYSDEINTETNPNSALVKKLRNINLDIPKKNFFVITGVIGSGKSSLLSAIAGVMKSTHGSITINGSLLSYGEPWIHNATIRDNILFGKSYDKEFYDQVVYSCALQSDLQNFEAGDYTEVGERGITLSGGQKARICLARAIYSNHEIYLLDDVLSAVDAKVGKHIVDHAFAGLLKEKTVILATHQLSLVKNANSVIFMNTDGTVEVGTITELKTRSSAFKALLNSSIQPDDEIQPEAEKNDEVSVSAELIDKQSVNSSEQGNALKRRKVGLTREKSTDNEDDEDAFKDIDLGKDVNKGQLITKEHQAVNRLRSEVYRSYLKAGSGKLSTPGFLAVFVMLFCLAPFFELFTTTWLSFWVDYKFEGRADKFYMGIYVMFTMLSVFTLAAEFVVLVRMTTKASKELNLMALKRVLFSPMSFIDTTPMGRILNRFAKDTDALDNEIGEELRLLCTALGRLGGVLVLNAIFLPWVLLVMVPIFMLCWVLAEYYQASCREIKRIEAVNRSLVYNNHAEVMGGMFTINAYDNKTLFLSKNLRMMNQVNEASFLVAALQRWLNIHLEVLSGIFSLVVGLLCVNRVFHISASTVGLLLVYVTQLTAEVTLVLRMATQVENSMNSVERLHEYAEKIPQEEEANRIQSSEVIDAQWPQEGAIQFQHASMAYRPGLPLVLKDLDICIRPREKVGICGRTGAGKSSIMAALYRLTELDMGKILIDGIDISSVDLKTLRSVLSIIPQDPVLFNGSIRKNLDPFGDHNDDKLWDALRRSGAILSEELEGVKKQQKKPLDGAGDEENSHLHQFHLDREVTGEGTNFSLGQRQLISFARAMVRDIKILILDEATSSVDYETDNKIQQIIKTEFDQCTILCIAHRLKTIVNYDRIMTLDHGELKEFDTPLNLFTREDSIFRNMCDKSGVTKADFH